ncbi:MAG: hypothetical protein ACRDZX_06985 [Acidimicrobiales bacterium]
MSWVTVAALSRRPDLWATAARQLATLAPPRWWGRWPPLPRADERYLSFRAEAMYGKTEARVTPAEMVGYLEWCRRMRAMAR